MANRRRRRLRRLGAVVAVLILVVLITFSISPRPGARLIRYAFEKDAANVKRALEAHAPGGTSSLTDQPYRSGDENARLDVYFPETVGPDEQLPTVVSTHGGAWISGHNDDAAPYFQLIAAESYAVVSLGYSLPPEATYPTPSTRSTTHFPMSSSTPRGSTSTRIGSCWPATPQALRS